MSRFVMLGILALAPLQLLGQSCTGATCNAASPALADVLAALPAPGNTNPTVVVNIPSGTSNWTTGISYTVPAAVTNLTIQGATVVSCSGTAGTSSYACSATDNTNIVDTVASNSPLLTITGSGGAIRLTGITLQGGTLGGGNSKFNGILETFGTGTFRWDHNHCNLKTYSPAYANASGCWKNGPVASTGFATTFTQMVADHFLNDLTDKNDGSQIEFGFSNYNPYNDTIGLGDGPFARATPWGSFTGVMYVESGVFNGGAPNDVGGGASMVMRKNTFVNTYIAVQTHGTKSQGGPTRGGRSIEAYQNYFTCGAGCNPGPASALVGTKGTAALMWGNTVSGQPAYHFYNGGGDRQSGDETETAPPNGWGYCGTTVNGNGQGSCWDGASGGSGSCTQGGTSAFNAPTGSGYPCLDGLGRGQDQQALNGQVFNSTYTAGRLNSVTSKISWTEQYLEPQYLWNNDIGTIAASNYMLINDGSVNNQDYSYDCTAQSVTGCNGSFNGTSGTGFGLFSARPATCTAGAGGTYLASPTGSYGVAYFATDAGANGTLYVCTSANTWTPIYTVPVYPHPLVSGSSTFTLTLASTGAGSGTFSGLNCANASYPSGTSVTCNAVPSAGSSGSLTGAGSASACGGTTCTFSLAANSGVTGNFTLNSYTLSTATTGTGTGTITGCAGAHNFGAAYSCTLTATSGTLTGASGCGGTLSGTTYSGTMPAGSCTVTGTFSAQAATPTFSPVAGTYGSTQNVTPSSSTAGATICYRLDGVNPTSPSPGVCAAGSTQFVSAVSVSTSLTFKAIATKVGYTDSAVGSAAYVITYTLSTATVGSGTVVCTPTGSGVTAGTSVSCVITPSGGGITTAVSGCGGTWTSSPYLFNMPANSCTVTATFNGAAAAPVFAPVPDTYASGLPVVILTNTPGATIRYTTDGSTPTSSHGTIYTAGVSIGSSLTLKAIAYEAGFGDSPVTSGAYVISGTPSVLFTATLSSNANSSGIVVTPARKQLGNVGTGCSGGVIQPTGVPVGQLYATAAIRSAAIAAGCATQNAVTVTSSGVGIANMDNGQNSGGTDSPVTVTDTYGGNSDDAICSGDPNNSLATPITGLSPLTCVSNSSATFAESTAAGHGNSDVLWPSDYASNSTTLDSALYYYRDMYWIPDNVPTLHDWEFDTNINSSPTAYAGSTGAYAGWGFDWGATSGMFRTAPQGQPWTVLQGIDIAGGPSLFSYPLTSGHVYRTRNFGHRQAGCTATSGSNCMFYDYLTVYDVTAGTSPKTYALVDSSTGLPVGGIPVNHSSWASGPDVQVQIDMTAANASTQVRVISDTTVFYGSAPATTYTWAVTATHGSITGTNCGNASYASGNTIGPCTAVPDAGYSFTSWSGVSGSAACSGATNPCPSFSIGANSAATANFTLIPPATTSVSISGSVKFSGTVGVQ